MSRINTTDEIFEGESVVVKARVRNARTFENVLTADISELSLVVFDLDGDTPSQAVWEDRLTASEHWHDSLQTDGWRGTSGGFNFEDLIPGTHFTVEGGHRYKARHEAMLTDGQLIVIAETTVPVRERW